MVKKYFAIFLLGLTASISTKASYYQEFEGENRQEALRILAHKYHTLSRWFRCQRSKEEWIPFDESLAQCSLELAISYDRLRQIQSQPELYRQEIEYYENRIFKLRHGENLPDNYKTQKIHEVWDSNGQPVSYKVLKAYAKVTRPKLDWPGRIYITRLMADLYRCKRDKYLLFISLPGTGMNLMEEYAKKSENYHGLFEEQENKLKAATAIDSPEFGRKACEKDVVKQTTEPSISRSEKISFHDFVLIDKDSPPLSHRDVKKLTDELAGEKTPLLSQKTQDHPLRISGNYDDPSVLTKDETPKITSAKTLEEDLKKITQSTVKELSIEQQEQVNFLMTEVGMSQFQALETILL